MVLETAACQMICANPSSSNFWIIATNSFVTRIYSRSSGGDNQGRDWSLYLFQDEIAVCPGRTYAFQSFFRQDTVGNCRISAQVDETLTIAGPTPVAGTSWMLISGTYTVPADKTTITLFVRGDCTHTGPENGLWADEVTLTLTEQ